MINMPFHLLRLTFSRNANHTIAASNGMIEHHEQYDELILGSTSSTGGHTQFECIACHNVHRSALYDAPNAIKNYAENYELHRERMPR